MSIKTMFGDKDYSDIADALLQDNTLEEILDNNDLTVRDVIIHLIEQGLIDIEAYPDGLVT